MTNTRTLNKDECDYEVYSHGEVIGVFDMPKDKANELVVKLSKKTGTRIDWHYVGGRVVMKMLPPKASVNSRTLKSRNQREGWYWGFGKFSKRHLRTEFNQFSLKHTNDRGSKSHDHSSTRVSRTKASNSTRPKNE